MFPLVPTQAPASQSRSIMQAAGRRAVDSYVRARTVARRLSEALEEATAPHGVPVAGLDDGDSLVIAVRDAISVCSV